MASKFASLLRKRRLILVGVSVIAALISAKTGGIKPMGFWDGPI